MNCIMVGNGFMGNFYLPLLLTRFERVAVVDRLPARLVSANAAGPNVFVSDDVSLAVAATNPTVGIVLVNTPFHIAVIERLIAAGVKYIFVEKPLVMNWQEAIRVRSLAENAKVEICTAYLINFSPAVAKLFDIMTGENLAVCQSMGIWWKNRTFDTRMTPGDDQDEMTHQVRLFMLAIEFNQTIKNVQVSGRVTHLPFVNQATQQAAHILDPSIPKRPSSSCTYILDVRTNEATSIMGSFQSSFISIVQQREAHFTLARKDEPNKLGYLARLAFDTPDGDELEIVPAGVKAEPNRYVFESKNKVPDEIDGFLDLVRSGVGDNRLTRLSSACGLVRLTESVANR